MADGVRRAFATAFALAILEQASMATAAGWKTAAGEVVRAADSTAVDGLGAAAAPSSARLPGSPSGCTLSISAGA